jgi:xylulokinase
LADVYKLPIQQPALVEEATSLGAAIAGGIGVGLFKDISIAARLAPVADTTMPREQAAAVYDRLSAIFNQAYDALVPVYEGLAAL